MHENNISLLAEEAERLLQLNINQLNQMMAEPQVLSEEQAQADDQLFNRSKAVKRLAELKGEQVKITRREMVLAVVGTVKAGKSTTINAIVGKEVLPNHNRPMTALPTLIRHVPGKIDPDLQFTNLAPVQKLLRTITTKLKTSKGKQLAVQIRDNPEQRHLLDIVKNDSWLRDRYRGEEQIFDFLASLNNLVRLATAMQIEFPFASYSEIQQLPVIEVEFTHLTGMDESQGTLTLLDTPGPNEAGQPHLKEMLRDQLQKASAVLAVMDYSQLNSEADSAMRKELNAIAQVSAGRLFILVNKFDQKNARSDNAEMLKQAVPSMLDDGMIAAERIFPGSSQQALLANSARRALKTQGSLPKNAQWVEDFIEKAFAASWEEEFYEDTLKLNQTADLLWKKSQFDRLITQVIQASHANAAALAIDSAVSKLRQNAQEMYEYLGIRHQGQLTSIQALQDQIAGLLSDIDDLNGCQTTVNSQVKASMAQIDRESEQLLTSVKNELSQSINAYFKQGKRPGQMTQFSSKQKGFAGKKPFPSGASEAGRDFDPQTPEVKFSQRNEAEAFVATIEHSVMLILNQAEEKIKPKLAAAVAQIEKNFQGTTLQAVDQIAQQINARLHDGGFQINIRFPQVQNLQASLNVRTRMTSLLEEKSVSETRQRRSSGAWGTFCSWFNTDDWGWESYQQQVTYSTISLEKIRKAVTQQANEHFDALNEAIALSVKQPVNAEISTFFHNFREKVGQLCNTLRKSADDHDASKADQEQLTLLLQTLRQLSAEMVRDCQELKSQLESILK